MNKLPSVTSELETDTALNEISSHADEAEAVSSCSNCGTKLNGQYCHECGQSSKSMIKFFGEVIRELIDDALGYDSRLKHSLIPLFLKPGKLTLDYVKGKRFYYVMPFRLYLITSVILILIIKYTTHVNLEIEPEEVQVATQEIDKPRVNQSSTQDSNQDPSLALISKDSLSSKDTKRPIEREVDEAQLDEHSSDLESSESKQKKSLSFSYKWDSKTEQWENVDQLEDGIEKDFLLNVEPKIKGWKKNPEPLIKSFIEVLPYMMFVILPIFGIILKGFYAFSHRYYTEHLIFLLHNHSFMYFVFITLSALSGINSFLSVEQGWLAGFFSTLIDWIYILLNLWLVAYIFLAMKRFYNQGWVMTIFKTFCLSIIYSILLLIGFMFSIVIGAYQA